jgi:hypothetical protein
MRFLGRCRTTAFYPAQSREDAVTVVQKDLFAFSNGLAGSAVYLYTTKEFGFEDAPWLIECQAFFENLAEISVAKGEFHDLFGLKRNEQVPLDVHNEQQRKVILWAGYDGFFIDKKYVAIYSNTLKLHAIKAFPKVNDPEKSSSYNEIWKKLKKLSGVFSKEPQK